MGLVHVEEQAACGDLGSDWGWCQAPCGDWVLPQSSGTEPQEAQIICMHQRFYLIFFFPSKASAVM